MQSVLKDCTYLLPIRRAAFDPAEAEGLRRYFEELVAAGCELLVIDGSPDDVVAQHDRLWSGVCRHERVDRQHGYLNDKVNGVHTGVALASHEKVILADDDIRYSAANVRETCALLETFDVVRPQNYLRPLPWWARMEAARMLINRATLRTADYPGTCAFRRTTMLGVGHYDGDVLFDNEEIIRHFASSGASICYANNLFVQKRPPSFRKWREQRPRQAYEDFPLRTKTAIFFLIPFLLLGAALIGKFLATLLAVVLISIALAFVGRARGDAAKFFPASIPLHAPLWILERSFSTYAALYWLVRRGGYPFGDQLLTKGVGRDWFAGRMRGHPERSAAK
ncbi:MAG: glycosyltransferase [Chthoniobacterales bacterium]